MCRCFSRRSQWEDQAAQRERVLAARLETAEHGLDAAKERERELKEQVEYWRGQSQNGGEAEKIHRLTLEVDRLQRGNQAKSEWEASASKQIERMQGELQTARVREAALREQLQGASAADPELNSRLVAAAAKAEAAGAAAAAQEQELKSTQEQLVISERARQEALGQLLVTERQIVALTRQRGALPPLESGHSLPPLDKNFRPAPEAVFVGAGSPQVSSRLDMVRRRIDQLQQNTNQVRVASDVTEYKQQLAFGMQIGGPPLPGVQVDLEME